MLVILAVLTVFFPYTVYFAFSRGQNEIDLAVFFCCDVPFDHSGFRLPILSHSFLLFSFLECELLRLSA